MATATTTPGIFGYTGGLSKIIAGRSKRETKYSKSQQAHMIHAILSRRMMSPPSYEDIIDYVDSNVTYAENKREVLAVFGERSRIARVTDKQMREMYCTSLHNQCASNGLDTCEEACNECKNPAACKKADKIDAEIKTHGRELTHIERMQREHEEEAKRSLMKAKFTMGQIIKCREGYELQCGFKGLHKITRVNAYPDYVMYGIKGKAQGFVEEDWIVGVKVKGMPKKTVSKSKVVKPVKTAKVTKQPKKVKKVKPVRVVKPVKKLKRTKTALHSKILTDAQIKHARKYGYVKVTIDGVKKKATKRNYAPRKRVIQWYKAGGKVCLKTVKR